MLAISAARKAASAVAKPVGTLAGLPFPLPFALTRAPVSPLNVGCGVSLCAVAFWGRCCGTVRCTTQSTNRRLPSQRSVRQIPNRSF